MWAWRKKGQENPKANKILNNDHRQKQDPNLKSNLNIFKVTKSELSIRNSKHTFVWHFKN